MKLLLLFSFLLLVRVLSAQTDSVTFYPNGAKHEIFSPLSSDSLSYEEFSASGVVLKKGKMLRTYIDSTAQVEDPVTHMFHIVYDVQRNIPIGEWKEFYPDGKEKASYSLSAPATYSGNYSEKREDGKVIASGVYVNGYKAGLWLYGTDSAEYYSPSVYGTFCDYRMKYSDSALLEFLDLDPPGDPVEYYSFYPDGKLKEYGKYGAYLGPSPIAAHTF